MTEYNSTLDDSARTHASLGFFTMLISETSQQTSPRLNAIISNAFCSIQSWFNAGLASSQQIHDASETQGAGVQNPIDPETLAALIVEVHPMVTTYQLEDEAIARLRNSLGYSGF